MKIFPLAAGCPPIQTAKFLDELNQFLYRSKRYPLRHAVMWVLLRVKEVLKRTQLRIRSGVVS